MPLPLLDFDPYAAWLGITDRDRPLNPYQLLRLTPLDGDPGHIRLALERQQLRLASHSGGTDAELWRSLQEELEVAAAALPDPERRGGGGAAMGGQSGKGHCTTLSHSSLATAAAPMRNCGDRSRRSSR